MKISLLILTALFGTQAYALDIDVKARIPVDCATERHERTVTYLTAYSPSSEENTIGISLNFGRCRGGVFEHQDTAPDYDFYLVDMGYTQGLRTEHKLQGTRGSTTVMSKMSADPRSLFAQGGSHHFVASFYPFANSEAFVWDLVFSQDPATGRIQLAVEPRK